MSYQAEFLPITILPSGPFSEAEAGHGCAFQKCHDSR